VIDVHAIVFLRMLSYKLVRWIILICETGMLLQPTFPGGPQTIQVQTLKKQYKKKEKS